MADRAAFHSQMGEVFTGGNIEIGLYVGQLRFDFGVDLLFVCREVHWISGQFFSRCSSSFSVAAMISVFFMVRRVPFFLMLG
jgi:hypothetical protein